MTDSDVQVETWKPVPGAGYYEASDQGRVRSVDRTIDGRHYDSVTLKPREDGDGYLVVNYTDDDRVRHHGVSVARLVLLAHDPDGYAPGLEACHGPAGRKDNRRVNLRWDTDEANRLEALEVRLQNRPPKPKPLKTCPRCARQHDGTGRNCHECVVKLGVDGAKLRAAGVGLQDAADQLGYPPVALDNLTIKYGGLRMYVEPANLRWGTPADPLPDKPSPPVRHPESPPSWLRRVLFRREASRQNSDAQ